MKRGILYVIILLLVPLVSAQDFMIGETSYPLVIFVPLLLVLFIWIIILIVYLKNNFHKFTLILYNLKKALQKTSFWKIPNAIKKIRKLKAEDKKKEEESEDKKEDKSEDKKEFKIKKDLTPHVDKISKFETKLPKLKNDEAFKSFNNLTKNFFSDLLGMNYEFTDQELIKELHKKRKGLIQFANDLAHLKYSGTEITKEHMTKLLDEFKAIVKTHAKESQERKAKKPLSTIDFLIKQDKKIFENIKKYIKFLKTENRKKQIKNLLDEERSILKNNIKTIKKTYNQILDYYTQLSPSDRAKIYPELMEFYQNINRAIFSSVYGEKSKEELRYFKEELNKIKNKPKKLSAIIKAKHILKNLWPEKKEKKKVLPEVKKKPIKFEPSIEASKQIDKLKQEEEKILQAIRKTMQEDIESERDKEAKKLQLLKQKREDLAIKDFQKEVVEEAKPNVTEPIDDELINEEPSKDMLRPIKPTSSSPEDVSELDKQKELLQTKMNELHEQTKNDHVMKNQKSNIQSKERRDYRKTRELIAKGWRYLENKNISIAKRMCTQAKKHAENLSERYECALHPSLISLEMEIEKRIRLSNQTVKQPKKVKKKKLNSLEEEQNALIQEIEKLKVDL